MHGVGLSQASPSFKVRERWKEVEIINGTLRAPEIHLNGCSSVRFLSADGTRSPYDLEEEDTATPHASTIEKSGDFFQLNVMSSVLLRMTLVPVPMEVVSHMPDLKAAYHALSCEYGRYNYPCTYGSCNDMSKWMDVEFRNDEHPSEFLEEWKAALDDLLVDHELDLETILDVFIRAIRDHDGIEDFLHSLQFGHSSMEMVYRQSVQHVFFSEF